MLFEGLNRNIDISDDVICSNTTVFLSFVLLVCVTKMNLLIVVICQIKLHVVLLNLSRLLP